MGRRRPQRDESSPDQVELYRRRARRWLSRGNARKAALALREVVRVTGEAAAWVSLGDTLAKARRPDDAIEALRQGLWLYRQRGESGRARSVARLILALDPSDRKAAFLATI